MTPELRDKLAPRAYRIYANAIYTSRESALAAVEEELQVTRETARNLVQRGRDLARKGGA
jgi:hypothetical protein